MGIALSTMVVSPPLPEPAVSELDASDAGLVRAARVGDRRACFAIWSKYAALVQRLVRRFLGPGPDYADVCQEVFLRIFKRLDELREPAALRGFVVSIALGVARNESRELLANAQREASQELRESEARGNKLLEQARHQATELTNAARAEVEGTLEWARAQAASIMTRAQQGAEQLLGAAGLGEDKVGRVAESLVQAADREAQSARSPGGVMRQATSMLQASAAAAAATPAELETEEEPEVEEKPEVEPPMAAEPEVKGFASEETTVEESEIEEPSSEQTEGAGEPSESEDEGWTFGDADSEEEEEIEGEDETDQKGPGEDEPRRHF